MSERMTTIYLPGPVRAGFSDYGRKSPEHMIALLRSYAEYQLREATAVLDAPDKAFVVYTHTGVHTQRNREILQEGDGNA